MSQQTAVRSDRPARKQQTRSILTQQKLLDAAVQAFSENGFKGTSTRDIAERAGVHHPLITYHFKNKDQLWRAAADHVFSDFTQTLAKSLEEHKNMCPKARMSSLIRIYVNYAQSQPALHKVMIQEASYPNERLDWLIGKHLKPMFDVTFGMIEKLQDLGVVPPGDSAILFNMIRLCSGGLLALGNELKGSSGIDIEDPDTIGAIADTIIAIFLPGDMPADWTRGAAA